MVTDPVKVRLPKDISHNIDIKAASEAIAVVGNRVVVEMLPVDKPTTLLLPDNLINFWRGCVGVVIQSPNFVVKAKGKLIEPPMVGDLVIVHPQDGVHIDNAEMGKYKTSNQIRVYGAYAEYVGEPIACDWWESIMASIDTNMNLRAYGNKSIFKKDKSVGVSDHGIFLPDGHHQRNEMAIIVSRGPLADPDAKVGDRVSYNPHYIERDGVDLGTGVSNFDYFIASDLAINYVVTED